MGGYSKDGARPFTERHKDIIRASGLKLQDGKFRKDATISCAFFFSYHEGGQTLEQVPRKTVGSPS